MAAKKGCASLRAACTVVDGFQGLLQAEHYIHATHMYEITNVRASALTERLTKLTCVVVHKCNRAIDVQIKNRSLKFGVAISAMVAGLLLT